MTTPPLPDWIRSFRTRAYANIYQLCPDETRLYGTESLFGDWSGELLLLAKDFAPRRFVEERIAAGHPRPFSHQPWHPDPRATGAATNRRLSQLAGDIRCGKLYGSALAGLLRNDGKVSGALEDARGIRDFIRAMLRFTIDQMPKLRGIACLGVDAWDAALDALEVDPIPWARQRASRKALMAHRGVALFALAHPSRTPGGMQTVLGDWEIVKQMLSRERVA